MKNFLHVGCGPQYKDSLKGFKDWQEIRFDIDPKVKPDILGSLTDMSAVEDKSVEDDASEDGDSNDPYETLEVVRKNIKNER